MKRCSTMQLSGVLAVLLMMPVSHAPAQAPTEEELKEFERQAEQLEKKQAQAKRQAEAARRAAAEAKRKVEAAKKAAAAEELRSAASKVSALTGEFVDIPGGTFQMGCSPGDGDCDDERPVYTVSERPVHTVSINPFRMGKYEVTLGQFRRFVEAAGYRTDAGRGGGCDWKDPGFPQTERHPVVCVSWNDAQAYVHWLSRQGGGRYRLPSESEWEYAARAGGSGRYSFGDNEGMLCDYGNVADRTFQLRLINQSLAPCDDGVLYSAPVGGYRPNRFGLYDMHGNVSEWTEDCYHKSYAGAPSDEAAWTAGDCVGRVVRGGSWDLLPWFVRSASRMWFAPDSRYNYLGFRLAQDR
ncbi:MAG: formylglycine-generating enzyme family protein [Gammaproteobacteria bacterium]